MRRGSFTLVTRPSTLAPTGITVFPSTITAWVNCAWNGSPGLLLKVPRVVSTRTIREVPAGTAELVWAASIAAKSSMQGRTIHFFMVPPKNPGGSSSSTLDQPVVRDNTQPDRGTSGDKGPAVLAGWPVPDAENAA